MWSVRKHRFRGRLLTHSSTVAVTREEAHALKSTALLPSLSYQSAIINLSITATIMASYGYVVVHGFGSQPWRAAHNRPKQLLVSASACSWSNIDISHGQSISWALWSQVNLVSWSILLMLRNVQSNCGCIINWSMTWSINHGERILVLLLWLWLWLFYYYY